MAAMGESLMRSARGLDAALRWFSLSMGGVMCLLVIASPAGRAAAQPASPAPAPVAAAAGAAVTVGGYVEEYYQLQLQDASNRITNLRGFDNRSRTFTLSNVALDVKAETGPLAGHVIFQVGHTPST